MKKTSFVSLAVACAVVLVVGLLVFNAGSPQAAQAPSVRAAASAASAGQVVVMPSRDLTFFYVVDGADGNIYVVDVSGGSGEVRNIKLAGNFRAKKVY